MKDGEPWFVAKDACDALGIQQTVRAVENLDSDEVSKTHVTDSLNRQQETYIISESGLYALVIRSNKPNAREFRKWVTGEVLKNSENFSVWILRKENLQTSPVWG